MFCQEKHHNFYKHNCLVTHPKNVKIQTYHIYEKKKPIATNLKSNRHLDALSEAGNISTIFRVYV